ncbi:mitochondrial carrier domain-containing protein [Geopyxis carbonaria]|nr:mitochondrial carrier domain-containing protein [Geopyxis carbonaria]
MATAQLPQMTSQPPKSKSHFLSGGASGLLSAVILQPADLLKTRLQQAPPSRSATATLVSTLRTIASGPTPIRSLWRGTLPSALRTGVGSALYFSALNAVRSRLPPVGAAKTGSSSSLPQLGALANLTAGAATRAGVGFLMMPITVLKVRYESSLYAYRSLGGAARDIMRTEGMRGFFAGWGATAIRDAPYAGLYVVFYEQGKATLGRLWLRRGGGEEGMGNAVNAVAAAGAGAAATAVTNPFDALKTRIQVDPERYRNMVHAARLVWGEETAAGRWKGRALFDGLGLRMARKAASSAAVWGMYEALIRDAPEKPV